MESHIVLRKIVPMVTIFLSVPYYTQLPLDIYYSNRSYGTYEFGVRNESEIQPILLGLKNNQAYFVVTWHIKQLIPMAVLSSGCRITHNALEQPKQSNSISYDVGKIIVIFSYESPYVSGDGMNGSRRKKMKFDFTVIIPTLNEEATIGLTIRNVQEIVKKEPLNAQILIVDDNSSDKTLVIVNEIRFIKTI